TLIFTKTASFESILSYFLLFFTGGIVSLEKLPKVVVNISEMLPLTIGIRLSQNILIGNKITANDLINLIFNSGFYVLIGLIVFKLCYYYTKRDGLSTEY
ncbi:hypothetical protein, partial [Caloranaerobacter sp. DY30410]|uniref:hypothetical protein n=1 Tax=Caloranaerobacter sp. DY30410 TaxID=3238305 RepID=UPI003D04423E